MGRRKDLDIGEEKGRIDREELLKMLDDLKPGLAVSNILDQMDHYLFMGDRIATCDGEICVVGEFPIGFSGSVKASEFYKLLSGMDSKKLELTLEKGQLTAGEGKSAFGLVYREPGEFHSLVESFGYGDLSWRKLSEEMKRAIGLCSFSASKDMTKPVLSGVYVGGGDVLSSNNYRISWFQPEEGAIKRNFLIPASAAVHLIHYDLDRYSLTDSWMHFKGKGLFYSARLLGGEFPSNAKMFFPEEYGEGFELPEELIEALNKSMILLQEDSLLNKQVDLFFKRDKIICSVRKKDVGWVREEVSLKGGPKEPIKLSINPVFLKEVLRYATRVVAVDENRIIFLSDNFRHLIALEE